MAVISAVISKRANILLPASFSQQKYLIVLFLPLFARKKVSPLYSPEAPIPPHF